MNKAVIICFLSCGILSAQNLSTPEVYLIDNQYIFSSAWAGIGTTYKFRGITESRLTEVENAPVTFIATLSGRIVGRSGIGLIIENDVNGFTHIIKATGSYAYHLTLNDDNNEFLSFGLSARYSAFYIDTSQFIDGQDDPAIGENQNINEVNFDTGILYRRKQLFINLNITDIIERKDRFTDNEPLWVPSLSFYSGYIFKQRNKWQIEPSFRYQLFYADSRSELDLNLKLQKEQYDMNYWGALVFKLQPDEAFRGISLTPLVGLKYGRMYYSYGYQIGLDELGTNMNLNRHMFSIGFDFINLSLENKCLL
jgi:type IX secretion system PorP/SprF family membrane protein